MHPESGPGQFEIVTLHEPAMQAADSLIYRKETISAVARRHSLVASFMPKPFADQAGSGTHCHVSLLAEDGRNAMADGEQPFSLSAIGEAFAAGILEHLPAVMAFTAAHPNSYRRIAPGTWSGAYRCWGVNNKECPLRLVGLPGRPESVNFEVKTVDGTANPHLALAALITAGVLGIRGGSVLPGPVQVDPARLSDQEREDAGCERLPCTLAEALDCLEQDALFGDAFDEIVGGTALRQAYVAVKRLEAEFFENTTLDEELVLLHDRF